MTELAAAQTLRALITAAGTVEVPGVFNALTARAAELNGFDAAFVGGSFTAAFTYGVPDIGMVTTTELIGDAARVARAVSIPVIADIDDGGGNTFRVRRTVADAVACGIAGVQLEDLDPTAGKHLVGNGSGDSLRPVEEAVALFEAAREASSDSGLVIVARTDAVGVTSARDALDRSRKYVEAGADIALITGLTPGLVSRARSEIQAPVGTFVTDPSARERQRFLDEGVDLLLYPRACGMPAFQAAWDALAALRTDGTLGAYSQDTHRDHYRCALRADRY
jgi:2,3-dimethylmalate lyase